MKRVKTKQYAVEVGVEAHYTVVVRASSITSAAAQANIFAERRLALDMPVGSVSTVETLDAKEILG